MWRNFPRTFSAVKNVKRFWFSTRVGINSNAAADYDQALPFEDIPGPKGVKYLGTLHQYMTGKLNKYEYKDILERYFSKYGPIFKETLFNRTVVHVCHPEMVKVIYQDEGKYPQIEPMVEPTMKSRGDVGMSLGLGNMNDVQWYRLRSAVQKQMMKPDEVSKYLSQVNKVANDFVEKTMIKGYSEDFILDSSLWNLESSGYICFGKRLGYLKSGTEEEAEAIKFVKMNDQTFTLATALKFSIPFYEYIQTPSYKALLEAENYVTKVTSRYFDEILQIFETHVDKSLNVENIHRFHRFIYSLICHKNLSKKDIEVIVLSMFIDGLRTVVPMFVAVLYCLAQFPRAQRELFKEIHKVLGNRRIITVSDIAQLPYLKACVKEAFRLYPNALEISRVCKNNIVLGGYQIPPGTKLNLNNFNMYRNSAIFDNPETFLPERWLRGSEYAADVHPWLLIPFGRGPRMCIGRRFAEQDLYVLISKFIQKCEPQWKGGVFSQQYKILLCPDRRVMFEFKPR